MVNVALFVRAWIEIIVTPAEYIPVPVALFVRAWIEIGVGRNQAQAGYCRSLRESVD